MTATFALILLLLTSGQNLLNNPESVVYDAEYDRFLVSNCGDGNIIQVNSTANAEQAGTPSPVMQVFYTGLEIALGTHIMGGNLYVACKTKVVGFDLATAEMVMNVEIAESQLLNDVASDSNGFLYVTDSEAFKIFQIDPVNHTYTVFVESGINRCNGILFDEKNNRLIVCTDKFNAAIHGVDLTDGTVSLIVDTNLKYMDGLAFDSQGYVYVSSWFNHSVFRFESTFTDPPVLFSKGHKGPADISYCGKDNVITVPNYMGNRIECVKVEHYGTPVKASPSSAKPPQLHNCGGGISSYGGTARRMHR